MHKFGTTIEVDQTSMNKRIEELYIEEIEKDIINKITQQGYEVISCKVDAQILNNEDDTKIKNIKMKIKKNVDLEEQKENSTVENKIVAEIQKIKIVNTSIEKEKVDKKENNSKESLTKTEIKNIKNFLIQEYGVSEKCLEIS